MAKLIIRCREKEDAETLVKLLEDVKAGKVEIRWAFKVFDVVSAGTTEPEGKGEGEEEEEEEGLGEDEL